MHFEFKWSVILESLPFLFSGLKITIWTALMGLIGASIIGITVGFMRVYGNQFLKWCTLFFIDLMRGTPIVVQAMFVYFALPRLFPILNMDPISAAILTIMLNSGAYIAEITRGAVLSINKGFTEAGLALGLSKGNILRYIVSPLAFRRMLPPLGNQAINSIKDTSFFMVIGLAELTYKGQEIIATNFRSFEIWSIVAIFYLVLTLGLSFILRKLEKKLKII